MRVHPRVGRDDCRHIAAMIDGITVHNLYIPAGGDIPDRTVNDKFGHKLDFVDELTTWFPQEHGPRARVVACGDFNIAPHEHDVWSHRQLMDVVSHTSIEIEKLAAMQRAMTWVDVARTFIPMDQKCYTWWSYRNGDWRRSNRGRRLDHVWVTPALKPHLRTHQVMVDARDLDRPSDHVPVVVTVG
jgi:exodeoxyribonuclease III